MQWSWRGWIVKGFTGRKKGQYNRKKWIFVMFKNGCGERSSPWLFYSLTRVEGASSLITRTFN